MTGTPRFLDGFLAAVRPGRCPAPPPEIRPEPAAPVLPPAALDDLSEEERIKRRLHPLDAFPRLLECAGTNRVPDADDRFRCRWFGLFHQAPEQDAFLLRLRLPGGRLRAFQLSGLAEITQAHASGQVVLNPQGGLDIPGVPVRAAVEILRAVEGIGLSARQTGGDCVQAVRGGEDDGLPADGSRTSFGPFVDALEQVLAHDRALADLPRPCEMAFERADESPRQSHANEIDLVSLREVSVAFSGAGDAPNFLLSVHGGLEGGFLLPASRAVPGSVKLLQAWAAGADRTNRAGAGLASFCRALGHERVSDLIENAPWQPPSPRPETGPGNGGSKSPPGVAVPGGRLLSGQLTLIEKIVRERGPGEIRLFRGCVYIGPSVTDDARAALGQVLTPG